MFIGFGDVTYLVRKKLTEKCLHCGDLYRIKDILVVLLQRWKDAREESKLKVSKTRKQLYFSKHVILSDLSVTGTSNLRRSFFITLM